MTVTANNCRPEQAAHLLRFAHMRTASSSCLLVFGELDVVTSGELEDALARVEADPNSCGVDLRHVSFADTFGLEPIVEAIRRSVSHHRDPLRICAAGPAVRRVFECLEVRWRPFLDLTAWDASETEGRRMWAEKLTS
jgi:anti-sigma B factor antagonist